MSDAAIRQEADGVLQLAGVLDFRSGPLLRTEGERLIRAAKPAALVLDCSAVVHSSSVGLSLLLAFMRVAQSAGKTMTVRALPIEMHQIAQVSGLTELLLLDA
ncbi:STAS domain-containing protein [Pseudomonas cavernicola]|uniref:STAS domain-containing protein n=1 Tax=Pseudomonas cavernicola TaxID=2320866 RepID=A0A418XHD5_9PSED|nr:STAS domain-containing protein [Pseudomonas cavernicola]RJG11889.1 STAS domain-containing protein [Pseudomonas cavernicola]